MEERNSGNGELENPFRLNNQRVSRRCQKNFVTAPTSPNQGEPSRFIDLLHGGIDAKGSDFHW